MTRSSSSGHRKVSDETLRQQRRREKEACTSNVSDRSQRKRVCQWCNAVKDSQAFFANTKRFCSQSCANHYSASRHQWIDGDRRHQKNNIVNVEREPKRCRKDRQNVSDSQTTSRKATPSESGTRSPEHREVFTYEYVTAMNVPEGELLTNPIKIIEPWTVGWNQGIQVVGAPDHIPETSWCLLDASDGLGDLYNRRIEGGHSCSPHLLDDLSTKTSSDRKRGLYQRPSTYIRCVDWDEDTDTDRCEYDMDTADLCWLAAFNDSSNQWNEDWYAQHHELEPLADTAAIEKVKDVKNKTDIIASRGKFMYSPPEAWCNLDADDFERLMYRFETVAYEQTLAHLKSAEHFKVGRQFDDDATCDVCSTGECSDVNELVFCDGCNVGVHQTCYGVEHIPAGEWLCNGCKEGVSGAAICILCPNQGGALKPVRLSSVPEDVLPAGYLETTGGKAWAHVSCALWVPETGFGLVNRMEPITKVDNIPDTRWRLVCCLCRVRSGVCVQCCVGACAAAMHVTCAQQQGLRMDIRPYRHGNEDTVKLDIYCPRHHALLPVTGAVVANVSMAATLGSSRLKGFKGTKNKNSNSSNSSVASNGTVQSLSAAREAIRDKREREAVLQTQVADMVSIEEVAELLSLPIFIVERAKMYWAMKRRQFGGPLLPQFVPATAAQKSRIYGDAHDSWQVLRAIRCDLDRARVLCEMLLHREKCGREIAKISLRLAEAVATDELLEYSPPPSLTLKQLLGLESGPSAPSESEPRKESLIPEWRKASTFQKRMYSVLSTSTGRSEQSPARAAAPPLRHTGTEKRRTLRSQDTLITTPPNELTSFSEFPVPHVHSIRDSCAICEVSVVESLPFSLKSRRRTRSSGTITSNIESSIVDGKELANRINRAARQQSKYDRERKDKIASDSIRDFFEYCRRFKASPSSSVLCEPLRAVPSRRIFPTYFDIITTPLDINTIERRVLSGVYKNLNDLGSKEFDAAIALERAIDQYLQGYGLCHQDDSDSTIESAGNNIRNRTRSLTNSEAKTCPDDSDGTTDAVLADVMVESNPFLASLPADIRHSACKIQEYLAAHEIGIGRRHCRQASLVAEKRIIEQQAKRRRIDDGTKSSVSHKVRARCRLRRGCRRPLGHRGTCKIT